MHKKKGGYTSPVPKISLSPTKLVPDKLYFFVQGESKHKLPPLPVGRPIWQQQMQQQCEDCPDLVSSSEDDRSDFLRNEKKRQPNQKILRKSRHTLPDYSHWLQIQRNTKSGIMLGGGINDSQKPLVLPNVVDPVVVPPVDADSPMALELQKALARSRKNKPKNPENEEKNQKRRQSQHDYDKKIFNLTDSVKEKQEIQAQQTAAINQQKIEAAMKQEVEEQANKMKQEVEEQANKIMNDLAHAAITDRRAHV